MRTQPVAEIMLATILTLFLMALPRATLHGTVRAEGSLAPIAGATVEIGALRRSTVTDERGYFTLPNVPEGRWVVRASALGYAAVERPTEITAQGAVTIEFALAARAVALEGVEIRVDGRPGLGDAPGPPSFRIDAREIERMPALVEPDVLRALQSLPSVQTISDFSSALYVRGGLPDQNLLTLDGAPVFNPYHMGGLFSAFDPSAISSVSLLPGAFPAGAGDRLSSVIDVRTKEGGRDRVRGAGGIGLISSRVSVDGPLRGGRGSYLLSGRRTYLDLFTDVAHRLGLIGGTLPYAFTDAHLKLTHDVGPLGQVTASAYLDDEGLGVRNTDGPEPGNRFPSREQARFGWGSRLASLGYWQPIGASLLAELRAGVSDFHGDFQVTKAAFDSAAHDYLPDSTVSLLDGRTTQRDWFASADLTWHGARDVRRAGFRIDRYHLDSHFLHTEPELEEFLPVFARRDRPWTAAAYAEEEWSPGGALSLRGGVRALFAGELGTAWLPRVGANYALSSRLSLSLGAGRSAQALRTLRNEESVYTSIMAYDVLAGVPRGAGLSTAEDVVLGAEWTNGPTRVRLDGYTKWLHRLAVAPVPDNFLETPVIEPDSFHLAEGIARGLEVLARHSRGGADFSLSYALSFVELESGGERYTPRFDRRHGLDASAALPWGRTGLLSARVAWATGQPYTPVIGITEAYWYEPIGRQFASDGSRVILGEHNAARLPGYFRVDAGARRDFTPRWFGKEVTLTPYLSVLNVFNTPNVLFALPEGYGRPQLLYPPQIPFFPTLGLEWTF